MKLFELSNLRFLHENMRAADQTRAVFPLSVFGALFECIYVTDIKPARLYLILQGVSRQYFELEVFKEYEVHRAVIGYKEILRCMEGKHELKQENFLVLLNSRIPKKFDRSAPYHEVVKAASMCRWDLEPDRVYFRGWKRNPPERKTAYGNYDKTRAAFGEEAAMLSLGKNISSQWSKDKKWERLEHYDELFRM